MGHLKHRPWRSQKDSLISSVGGEHRRGFLLHLPSAIVEGCPSAISFLAFLPAAGSGLGASLQGQGLQRWQWEATKGVGGHRWSLPLGPMKVKDEARLAGH